MIFTVTTRPKTLVVDGEFHIIYFGTLRKIPGVKIYGCNIQ